MTPARFEEVERICLGALNQPPGRRATYLDEACRDDVELRAQVEALLAGASAAEPFLETLPPARDLPALTAGQRLGAYEILASLGAGGMGEVYKARDTRLDRTVAIKVLRPEFSADRERRARFEREAKTVAGLSHPNICTLHDIGDEGGVTFLVMEHLAGETHEARLARGPLLLDQALAVAAEIGDALSAAHRQGVVHRDLKPGNVMLAKSGAKLLDFGLAKLTGHGEQPAAFLSAVPTQAATLTGQGVIVGTLQYMAPEQLEGKPPDARTDLWALGAILYEMVTAKRAFGGDSQPSLIGNIMNAEPAPLSTLQPLTPPALDRLVRRCLAKSPEDRPDTAHDVAADLRWMRETSGSHAQPAGRPRPRRVLWAGLGMAGVGIAFALVGASLLWQSRHAMPASVPAHLTMEVGPAEELNAGGQYDPSTPAGSLTALSWTPDGRSLVFVGRRGGVQQLYVRPLDVTEARPLANTEGAQVPAISPDGQWVAFWAQGAIRKVRITGGPASEVVPAVSAAPWGLTWDAQGALLFSRGEIWIAPPGRKAVPVTTRGAGERLHVMPFLLPGSRTLLYTIRRGFFSWSGDELIAQTLATGARRRLLADAIDARYVPSGHLVFMRLGVLYAVPFDPVRLERLGPETPVEEIAQGLISSNANDASGAGQFAVSPTGTLAWIDGTAPSLPQRRVVTMDLRGQIVPVPLPVHSHGLGLRLSPDGRRLALVVRTLASDSLWVYDLERGVSLPLTQDGEAGWPLWSPDGQHVLFQWNRKGAGAIWRAAADGTGQPEQLTAEGRVPIRPSSFAPSGDLAVVATNPDTGPDILVGRIENGKARLEPRLQSARAELFPEFSPDGRWLVFGSDMAVPGQTELYVQPYPGPGAAVPVSVGGGTNAVWHPSGRELFFVAPGTPSTGDRMMAVSFSSGSPPQIGRPREVLRLDRSLFGWSCSVRRCFDLAPDGQHFYVFQLIARTPYPVITHVNIFQNWLEELKAKVPPR